MILDKKSSFLYKLTACGVLLMLPITLVSCGSNSKKPAVDNKEGHNIEVDSRPILQCKGNNRRTVTVRVGVASDDTIQSIKTFRINEKTHSFEKWDDKGGRFYPACTKEHFLSVLSSKYSVNQHPFPPEIGNTIIQIDRTTGAISRFEWIKYTIDKNEFISTIDRFNGFCEKVAKPIVARNKF